MASNTVTHAQPTLQPPQTSTDPEFDPFSNAKPCSPFYLYNHDSPRPSGDFKSKQSVNISLQDLETGSTTLTPSTTQEKLALKKTSTRGLWRELTSRREEQCMTKPKQKSWLQRMPKKQRMIVKILIALFIIGCMVGIAVGIAVSLRSTVWKGNNNQGNIH